MNQIFARNFDQELVSGDPIAAASAADTLALAELKDEAFAQGHSAGRAEALQEAAANLSERQQAALDALAQSAADMRGEIDAQRQAIEHQLLEFALNTCERVLPEVLEATARDRVVEAITRCIALAGGVSILRVTVSEAVLRDHGAAIEQALGPSRADTRIDIKADPHMADGDAKVDWQHGSMDFSLSRTVDAILNAVRQALPTHSLEAKDRRSVTHD